jgi:hypothetical protein
MSRLSVRVAMLLVLVAAVSLAALRNANVYWAAAISTFVLLALATSVAGALALRTNERYAWAGFAVFTALYLAFTTLSQFSGPLSCFGPTVALNRLQSHFGEPRKPGSELLQLVRDRVELSELQRHIGFGDAEDKFLHKQIDTGSYALSQKINDLNRADASNGWHSWLPGAANTNEFLSIGHGVFAILFGLLGSVIGRMFYAQRERGEAQAILRHSSVVYK